MTTEEGYKRYICTICGHIYDEAEGDASTEIEPGTRFESLPSDWLCPDCGAGKDMFKPLGD